MKINVWQDNTSIQNQKKLYLSRPEPWSISRDAACADLDFKVR